MLLGFLPIKHRTAEAMKSLVIIMFIYKEEYLRAENFSLCFSAMTPPILKSTGRVLSGRAFQKVGIMPPAYNNILCKY